MQRSDSPARSVPGYWLGDPSAGFRWPFDWTFAAWRVWAALILPLALLLIFAVPAGVLLVLVAWRFGERARPHVMQIRDRKGRSRSALAVATLVVVGFLAVAPSPAWFFPLPWYLALLAAPLASAYVTKKTRRFFDDLNTPVSYWMALLPRIASGPRPRRERSTFVPAMETGDSAAPLSDLEYIALTIDPREVIVKTCTPKTPTLQFDRWLPADMQKGAQTLAWLSTLGVAASVTDGNVLLVKRVDKVTQVRPGHVVVQMPDGTIHSMTEGAFKAEFDVVRA